MKSKITTILASLFFIVTSLAFLASCDSNLQVAEGGMSGTGITTGPINAFGSVIVNGVEFDTSIATFTRDKEVVPGQDAYAVGEIVTIQGTFNADGKTGKATSVNFSNLLEGPVTAKSPLLADHLEVLGQIIRINDLTILNGFILLSDLNPGDIVEVSGFSDTNGEIQATSIRFKKTTSVPFGLKGAISNLDQTSETFKVNNLLVNYSDADISVTSQLSNGLVVEVTSRTLLNDILFAKTIRLVETINYAPESDFEIQGLITRLDSIAKFFINNLPVITTVNTTYEDGAIKDLVLNAQVEVEGTVDDKGNLVAKSVSLLAVDNLTKLEANLDAIDVQNRTFVVFGKTIRIDSSTILYDESSQKQNPLRFDDFIAGDYVDTKILVQTDGSLLALRLSREDQEEDISFKGIIRNVNPVEGSFSMVDISMVSDENTIYVDSDGQTIDKSTFFGKVKEGVSFIAVEGHPAGSNIVLVRSILVSRL